MSSLERGSVRFVLRDDRLLVANVGDPFSRTGLLSIMGLGLSAKTDDQEIHDQFADVLDPRTWIDRLRAQSLEVYATKHNLIEQDTAGELRTRHDYSGRLVLELLQNAHDVACVGSARIGHWGLGFKAVLSITDSVVIYSGEYAVLFDRERSAEALRQTHLPVPQRGAPVFQVPFAPGSDVDCEKLRADGFTTVVCLRLFASARDAVVRSLDALSSQYLLFAPALRRLEIDIDGRPRRHWQVVTNERDVRVEREAGPPEVWRRWAATQNGRLIAAMVVSIGEDGAPRFTPTAPRLAVHFPTDETLGVRVELHIDAPLASNRKHLEDGADRSPSVVQLLGIVADAARTLDPAFVLRALVPNAPSAGSAARIAEKIFATLCTTAFVPTYAGLCVRPGNAKLSTDLPVLCEFIPPSAPGAGQLVAPAVCDQGEVLARLGTQKLSIDDAGKLLAGARVSDEEASRRCVEAFGSTWARWKKVFPALGAEALAKAPVIWTSRGRIRAIRDTAPLDRELFFDDASADPRGWLPIEIAQALVRAEMDRWEGWRAAAKETNETADRHIDTVIVPILRDRQDDGFWETHGENVLRYLVAVLRRTKQKLPAFEDQLPLVPTDYDQRTALSMCVRLRNRRGTYLAAGRAYASAAWGRDPDFVPSDGAMENLEVADHADLVSGLDRAMAIALLRHLGVSWEPKLAAGKVLDSFPRCITRVGSLARRVSLIEPVWKALKARQSSPISTPAGGQLRTTRWIAVQPAEFWPERAAAPCELWLNAPKVGSRSITGILPVVQLRGLDEGDRARCSTLLKELGAREAAAATYADVRGWHDRLVNEICDLPWRHDHRRVGGRHDKLARELSQALVEALAETADAVPPARVFARFGSTAAGVVLEPRDAAEVAWADDDRLDRPATLEQVERCKQPVFVWSRPPDRLGAAMERLGLRRLSKLVTRKLEPGSRDDGESMRLEERLALYWPVLTAPIPSPPPPPSVRVSASLHVRHWLESNDLGPTPVVGWFEESCLHGAGHAPERGVAEALSMYVGTSAQKTLKIRNADWYENVLRSPTLEDALSRLVTINLTREQRDEVAGRCGMRADPGTSEGAAPAPPVPNAEMHETASSGSPPTTEEERVVPIPRAPSGPLSKGPPTPLRSALAAQQPPEAQRPDRSTSGSAPASRPLAIPKAAFARVLAQLTAGKGLRPSSGKRRARRKGRAPRGNTGAEAERWFLACLAPLSTALGAELSISTNEQAGGSESDFVLRWRGHEAHVELKRTSGTQIRWSVREIERARAVVASAKTFWLVVARPVLGEARYETYWFADPGTLLAGIACKIQLQATTGFLPYSGAWPPRDPSRLDELSGRELSSLLAKIEFQLGDAIARPHAHLVQDPMRPVCEWLASIGAPVR